MTDPSVPPAIKGVLGSPRTLAAWALVGYAALFLAFTFLIWITPGRGSVSGGAADAFGDFTSLVVMSMPVVAVVLAAYVSPPVAGAKFITLIALIEYGVAFLFGALTFLIGLGAAFEGVDNAEDAMRGLEYLVLGFARLALLAVAGYVVYRAFTGLGGRLSVSRTTVPPPAAPAP
jgi:hypothetical protein